MSITELKTAFFVLFHFFKNISNSFTVLKCIHKRVRFSKAIQRAIPQKFRMSASMLKCETTPFCYTPKYATIVLRSSGALKHWLVSSVASLAGSLVWGAVASSRATHTFNITTINTTDTTTRKVVFIIYINTFPSILEHFICQIHAPLFSLSQLHTATAYFLVAIVLFTFSQNKKQLRLDTTSQRPQTH